MKWMNLDEPRVYYVKWSESERKKQISNINTYIWDLEKWYWLACLQSRNRDANKQTLDPMWGGEDGMNWEGSTETCTLPCVKWMANGKSLCSTGSSTQCFVMTRRHGTGCGLGGSFKREETCAYLWLICIVVQKPTQYCKAIILQLKINFKKITIYNLSTCDCSESSEFQDFRSQISKLFRI